MRKKSALISLLLATSVLAHDREKFIEELTAQINKSGTGFRVADVIWKLPARYGTFADIDGDGDLDYLTTEMSHKREQLSVLRRDDDGWHVMDTMSQPFRGRHPLTPWFIPDDGEGSPAVLQPIGWRPYFYVIPMNRRGHLDAAKAVALDKKLPRRSSRDGGVDTNPYKVTRIEPRTGGGSIIHGTMRDTTSSGRAVWSDWSIEVTRKRGRFKLKPRSKRVRPDYDLAWQLPIELAARFDEGKDNEWARETMRRKMEREGKPNRAKLYRPPNDPESLLRRKVINWFLWDVDKDGTPDGVVVTGDFAAHVFPGRRNAKTKKLSFLPETERAAALDIRRARRIWPTDDEGVQKNSAYYREFVRMRFWKHGADAPVPLSILSSFGSTQVHYRWDGRRLVPALVQYQVFPRERPARYKGKRWVLPYLWVDEAHACIDANGDGLPETLQVQMIRHLEEPADTDDRPDRTSGELRAHLMLYKGVLPKELNGMIDANSKPQSIRAPAVSIVFPGAVVYPGDRHKGLPIELEPIPVAGKSRNERYCVYFRPWQVGIFLEPA